MVLGKEGVSQHKLRLNQALLTERKRFNDIVLTKNFTFRRVKNKNNYE
jgi:hypothetical protein